MTRFVSVLAVMVVMALAAACGGDDGESADPPGTTAEPTSTTSTSEVDATTASSTPAYDDEDDADGAADGGGEEPASDAPSFGEITIDGETVRFGLSGITYSQVEGVGDVTFEECTPDFFDAGMFVIGYPIDDGGELVLADNGDVAGFVQALLPYEETPPDTMEFEFDLEYDPLGVDARYRPESGSEFTYTIDGNSASGSVTLLDSAGDATQITFDITCAP